jgi:hypothetical protein
MERRLLWEYPPASRLDAKWRVASKLPLVSAMFVQSPAPYGYWLAPGVKQDMRTVFTIELKVDIASVDEERRKAFIDLAMETAKQIYSQAAMVAAKSPSITVSEVGAKGKINHPLFEETQPPE